MKNIILILLIAVLTACNGGGGGGGGGESSGGQSQSVNNSNPNVPEVTTNDELAGGQDDFTPGFEEEVSAPIQNQVVVVPKIPIEQVQKEEVVPNQENDLVEISNSQDEVVQETQEEQSTQPTQEEKQVEVVQETQQEQSTQPTQEEKQVEVVQETQQEQSTQPTQEEKQVEVVQESQQEQSTQPTQEEKQVEVVQETQEEQSTQPTQEEKQVEVAQETQEEQSSQPTQEEKQVEVVQESQQEPDKGQLPDQQKDEDQGKVVIDENNNIEKLLEDENLEADLEKVANSLESEFNFNPEVKKSSVLHLKNTLRHGIKFIRDGQRHVLYLDLYLNSKKESQLHLYTINLDENISSNKNYLFSSNIGRFHQVKHYSNGSLVLFTRRPNMIVHIPSANGDIQIHSLLSLAENPNSEAAKSLFTTMENASFAKNSQGCSLLYMKKKLATNVQEKAKLLDLNNKIINDQVSKSHWCNENSFFSVKEKIVSILEYSTFQSTANDFSSCEKYRLYWRNKGIFVSCLGQRLNSRGNRLRDFIQIQSGENTILTKLPPSPSNLLNTTKYRLLTNMIDPETGEIPLIYRFDKNDNWKSLKVTMTRKIASTARSIKANGEDELLINYGKGFVQINKDSLEFKSLPFFEDIIDFLPSDEPAPLLMTRQARIVQWHESLANSPVDYYVKRKEFWEDLKGHLVKDHSKDKIRVFGHVEQENDQLSFYGQDRNTKKNAIFEIIDETKLVHPIDTTGRRSPLVRYKNHFFFTRLKSVEGVYNNYLHHYQLAENQLIEHAPVDLGVIGKRRWVLSISENATMALYDRKNLLIMNISNKLITQRKSLIGFNQKFIPTNNNRFICLNGQEVYILNPIDGKLNIVSEIEDYRYHSRDLFYLENEKLFVAKHDGQLTSVKLPFHLLNYIE